MTITTTPYQDAILQYHATLNNAADPVQWATEQFAHWITVGSSLESAYLAAQVAQFTDAVKSDATRETVLSAVASSLAIIQPMPVTRG